jgi:hypothetical protein
MSFCLKKNGCIGFIREHLGRKKIISQRNLTNVLKFERYSSIGLKHEAALSMGLVIINWLHHDSSGLMYNLIFKTLIITKTLKP